MRMKTATLLGVVGLLTAAASGEILTLTDGNSEASFERTSGFSQIAWRVDNQNQLAVQRFAVNIGGTVSFLDDVIVDQYRTSNSDADPGFDTLVARYLVSGFEIITRYSLSGGAAGSGVSDISEQITIINRGAAGRSLSFFQFVDLSLGTTIEDDSVEIRGVPGNTQTAVQADNLSGVTVSETVVTPNPSRYQAGLTADVLAAILSGNLTNNPSLAQRADLSWAFQWNVGPLGANGSYLIAKDKRLEIRVPVPTPGAVGLLALGGLVATRRRRG